MKRSDQHRKLKKRLHQPGSPLSRILCIAAVAASGMIATAASAQSDPNTDHVQAPKHSVQEHAADQVPSGSLDDAARIASSGSDGALPRPDARRNRSDSTDMQQTAPDIGEQDPQGDSAEALDRNAHKVIPDWSQAFQPIAMFNPVLAALMNPSAGVLPRAWPEPDPGLIAR